MGFRGKILKFLESYLEDRYQAVCVGDFNSEYLKVKNGVPQGSILGPILFNLFINNIFNLECDFITLFADDAVFGFCDKNFNNLMTRLQSFVDVLSAWLFSNCLFPNTTKTSLMLFYFKNYALLPDVFFNGVKLNWVDNIKYLGIILDNKMKFNLQINKIENQISRSRGIIYRLSSFCSKNILLMLYFTLIYPYISQNIIIWGGVSNNKLN